jgi:hypothetical protein
LGKSKLLDDLLSIALIGTGRGKPPPVNGPQALQDAAAAIQDTSAEQRVLTQASLLAAYARAGCKPSDDNLSGCASAGPDVLEPCSARAAALLAELLCEGAKDLIAEWLSAAVKAKRRLPYRLLPDVLELARENKWLRETVAVVADQRGRWLMDQNADWQFTATDVIDESEWETGSFDKRLLMLRQIRLIDPAAARDLLQKTWKDDPAEQRAQFLKEFVTGLTLADEPFLESLLNDRSKQVRSVAADLLARLPGSQFVQRMTVRAMTLLSFKRGVLRNLKLDVTLPSELDKGAVSDGIEQTPPQGIGEKQWWLQQIISFVPPATWTRVSEQTPVNVIAITRKTEYSDVIIAGLIAAAERNADPDWLEPLLQDTYEKSGRLNSNLLSRLPADQFLSFIANILRDRQISLLACSDLVNHKNISFDFATARLWIERVGRAALHADIQQQAILYQLPERCAMHLPTGIHAEILAEWDINAEPWIRCRNSVNKLLKTLEIRDQIEKELK